ncbi:MAG: methyltransferase domain-containing protein [Calditrichaeota bacterium]|nr:methyltransferase domain-containing protein [Calditrichota bacterium]
MKKTLLQIARNNLSVETRRKLARLACWPPVGLVRFGSLRRRKPISADWGIDRGDPVDRYYISCFLEAHRDDVRGQVLEIGWDFYTRTYGGEKVTGSDVLHVVENRPGVTIIGDLTAAGHIPDERYDCIILTQTLQMIYDVPAALRTVYRVVKPGGVALVTVSGLISKVSRYDMDHWGHHWGFSSSSAQRLFAEVFPEANLQIASHGNVKSAIALLHGVAYQELRRKDLDYNDPDYQVLITIRAVKPGEAQ